MTNTLDSQLDKAAELVRGNGFVVLRERSYRAAQERQRIAEARMNDAIDQRDHQRGWMENEVFPRERLLADRVTFLYGAARAHGATVDELDYPTITPTPANPTEPANIRDVQQHVPMLTEVPRTQIMELGYQFWIGCSCDWPGRGRYTRVSAEDSHRRHVDEAQGATTPGGHRG